MCSCPPKSAAMPACGEHSHRQGRKTRVLAGTQSACKQNSRVAPALLTLRAAPAASAGNVQAARAASSTRACGRSWGPFLARELALPPGRPPGMSRRCSRHVNRRCKAAGVGWRLSLAQNPRSGLGCVLQTSFSSLYRTAQWFNGEWDCVGSPHRELGSGILQMAPRCRAGGRWAAAGQPADFDEGVGLSARRPARPHRKVSQPLVQGCKLCSCLKASSSKLMLFVHYI